MFSSPSDHYSQPAILLPSISSPVAPLLMNSKPHKPISNKSLLQASMYQTKTHQLLQKHLSGLAETGSSGASSARCQSANLAKGAADEVPLGCAADLLSIHGGSRSSSDKASQSGDDKTGELHFGGG